MAEYREVIKDAGRIDAKMAETELEKYRIIQDNQFVSEFDKYLLELE